jgi:hypothetical protein
MLKTTIAQGPAGHVVLVDSITKVTPDDAGATVTHTSARIGEAMDAWAHGVISHTNAAAAHLGLKVGEPLRSRLEALINP